MIAQLGLLDSQFALALIEIAPEGEKPARVFKRAAAAAKKARALAVEAQEELKRVALELELAAVSRELPENAANLLAALKGEAQ